MGAFYINNQKKINDLNEQISSKESVLNEKDKELSKKDEKLNFSKIGLSLSIHLSSSNKAFFLALSPTLS